MSKICAACGREVLPDAMCPPAPAFVKCELCNKPAVFITYRRARCFECRDVQVSAEFVPGTIQPKGEAPTPSGASPREIR